MNVPQLPISHRALPVAPRSRQTHSTSRALQVPRGGPGCDGRPTEGPGCDCRRGPQPVRAAQSSMRLLAQLLALRGGAERVIAPRVFRSGAINEMYSVQVSTPPEQPSEHHRPLNTCLATARGGAEVGPQSCRPLAYSIACCCSSTSSSRPTHTPSCSGTSGGIPPG